jgi:hypothetical protein
MNRWIIRPIVVALLALFAVPQFLVAGEPGGDSKTVETHLYAKLVGAVSQTGSWGYVRDYVVTKPTASLSHALLTVSARYLTVPRGSSVTFQLNGTTIGTATVTEYRRAHLRLWTRTGDTVPTINAGDTLTVVAPDGTTILLTGTFVTGPDLH